MTHERTRQHNAVPWAFVIGGWIPNSLAALAAIAIAFATVTPRTPITGDPIAATCIVCGAKATADLLLNLALFAPFGAALAFAGHRARRIALFCFGLSITVELLQFVIPGRHATLVDTVSNTAGGLLGALIAAVAMRWARDRAGAPVRAWASIAVVLVAVNATGWLLRPSPSSFPHFGQWTPRFENFEPWLGELDRATVGAVDVRHGLSERWPELRAALASEPRVEISGTMAPPATRLAAIFAVTDERFNELLLVGAEKDDIVVRFRRRADAWRLDSPSVRYPGLLTGTVAGSRFELTILRVAHDGCVVLDSVRSCAPPLAAGSMWTLLRPGFAREVPPLLLSAVTLALLMLPTGLLVRATSPRHRAFVLVAIAVGLPLATRAGGLQLPTLLEWVGVLVGLGLGAVVGTLARRNSAGLAASVIGKNRRG